MGGQDGIAIGLLHHLDRRVKMEVHAQRVRNNLRLVYAARASVVNVELLERDDIRLAGSDDFRNTRRGKLSVNTAALANVIRHLGPSPVMAQGRYTRIPTQYIAALGDPGSKSGSGAEAWGLWTVDPGPRGVRLRNYGALKAAGGLAPAKWRFDDSDWWLEENGSIMEQPSFPIPPHRDWHGQ
jgi:hypothetical protein